MNDTTTTPPGRSRRRVAGTVGLLAAGALAAVPGGTVYRVETDAGDGAYEAHMAKPDGTPVTVKLDSSFAVIGVEDGMGKGDPGPSGPAPSGTQGSTSGSSSPSAGV